MDYCSYSGALGLKVKITQYWAERGYDVNVKTVIGFSDRATCDRRGRTDIRSDMVNGMPVRVL